MERVELVMTKEQKTRLIARAQELGMGMSAFIRLSVLPNGIKGAPESPNTKSPRSLVGDQNDKPDGE